MLILEWVGKKLESPSMWRAGVEIFIRRAAPASALGVALHVEGVGRNREVNEIDGQRGCRPPCEGVGRNHGIRVTEKQTQIVALHVRAWVEIA